MQQNTQSLSKSKLGLIEADPSFIRNNSLNTSSSKMQYSIPKSKRFNKEKSQNQSSKFYDLPSLRSVRSTSFGYGNKIDISKRTVETPSPLKYHIIGQFEHRDNKSGITMGAGRDIVKNVTTFNQKPFNVPGPQHYDIKNIMIERTPNYSLSSRHVDLSDKWTKKVPGPGAYSTLQLVKNNAKLNVSKFSSSPSVSFTKDRRVSDYEQKIKFLNVPGPSKYNPEEGLHLVQKFKHFEGKRFGKSQRKGIVQKSITPGPGSYKLFSQFIY